MGFMDKVKAQTTVLAQKAQEGVTAGQAKLSDLQAKKQADGLLLELGGLVYSQHAGRATADTDAKITSLIQQLESHEAEHGPVATTSATIAPPPPGGGSFVPTSGGAAATPAQTPTAAPTPTAASDAGSPQSGGIPQSSGGIPTGTYSSDAQES